MKVYRQGDVVIIRRSRLPKGTSEQHQGRVVLAYGEVTGHAHVIEAPPDEMTVLTADEERRFLRLVHGATVTHEEHAPIALPPGVYEVRIQREWTDEQEPRRVLD